MEENTVSVLCSIVSHMAEPLVYIDGRTVWRGECLLKSTAACIIDREFEFYEFFSFLKFNEFYEFFFRLKKIRKKFVILQIIDV